MHWLDVDVIVWLYVYNAVCQYNATWIGNKRRDVIGFGTVHDLHVWYYGLHYLAYLVLLQIKYNIKNII